MFLDFSKAFDRVDKKTLFETLRRYKVPEHFVQAIRKLYVGRTVKLCIGVSETKALPCPHGVIQGDSLLALLYMIICNILPFFLDGDPQAVTLTPFNDLIYIDDIILTSVTVCVMESLLDIVLKVTSILGLVLNVNKCKVVVDSFGSSFSLKINYVVLEQVPSSLN